VDTFAWTRGVHQLKFGVDYRRLSPTSGGSNSCVATPGLAGFQNLVLGNVGAVVLQTKAAYSVKINNYSLFAQDTWRITNRLTLAYGLRWEINPPPESAASGQPIDQTNLALRRLFNLTERVKLDVRAEYFNVFNRPMFGARLRRTKLRIRDFGFWQGRYHDERRPRRRSLWRTEFAVRSRWSALRPVHPQTALLRSEPTDSAHIRDSHALI
jgi:TonB dependent receptor